jgi:HlyD family secretion protein
MNPAPSVIDHSANSNTNGSPTPSSGKGALAKDKHRGWRRYALYLFVGGGLLAVLLVVSAVFSFTRLIRTPYTGPTWTVKKELLRVTIIERGSLESAENGDITCRVKAGTKGSTNASIIKWIIDEGSAVKAGDPVIDLDDSGYQDDLKTKRNNVNRAYSDWVQAKTDYTYQEIENESNKKTAEVNLIQKVLELRKYVGELAGAKLLKMKSQEQIIAYMRSDFEKDVYKESADNGGKFTSGVVQTIASLEGNIENARSDKESWLDRAAWSQRMVKKSLLTLSQADSDQSKLASMEIALRMAEGSLDIYRRFDLEQQITTKWNDVMEARRNVKKVDIQATSKLEQKKATEISTRSIYDQEYDRLRDQEKDEKFYKIVAPQDGMVVYFVPEQSKGGIGSVQSVVAQGEPVREGQKLMRIPNLSKMVVNARVHEAMVSKLKGERVRPTGYSDILRATFTLGRNDLFAVASYYDVVEDMRDKNKDKDFQVTFPGHEARIRVDAYPGKIYKGHVKSVATVSAAAEFFSSDIKVYQTMVSIDDSTLEENLRPGMSAEVTITADETRQPVLVIPIQSVVGNVSMGADRKVYVLDADGYPVMRDIVVGLSSDKLVEVRSGDLKEGDKVVINPRSLLPEKSDMKPGTPSTRRGADSDDGGAKKGKKKGEGPGGPGGMPPGNDGKAFQRGPDAVPMPAPGANKK